MRSATPEGDDEKPTILLVGSGGDASHGDLIAGLARGARLLLLEPGPVTWQRPFVQEAADYEPGDPDAALEAARSLARAHRIDGVLSYLEPLLRPAAEIAERIGARGMSPGVAAIVRDKWLQRLALRAARSRPTRSCLVFDIESGRRAAAETGYPVVIKPRNFSGGLGVQIVPDLADFSDAWRAAVGTEPREDLAREPGALVEEFLGGSHFAVNCWVLDGEAAPLWVVKTLDDNPSGALIGGWVMGPGLAAPNVVSEIETAARDAALVCGLDRTIADVELKWLPGQARVLEVNGRPAGDQAVRMASLCSGLDPGHALAHVATGRRPAPPAPPGRAAGIVFIFPPEPMCFGGLNVPPALRASGWLDRWRVTAQIGAYVTPPPEDAWGRVGWALVTGPDVPTVEARMVQARHEIEVLAGDGEAVAAGL